MGPPRRSSLTPFTWGLAVLSALLVALWALVAAVGGGLRLPAYKDEEVYVECGLRYVAGLPPIECNFEHPPLAKYVIGASELVRLGRPLYAGLHALSCLLLYLIVYELTKSALLSTFVGGMLALDTLYLNTFRHLLLDPQAALYAVASVYLALKGRHLFSALLGGLGVASKVSAAPYPVALALHTLRRRGPKALLGYVLVSLAAYLAPYVADLTLGPLTVVEHHLEMIKYMSWRHGFSFPIAAIGFLKLITKVEAWRNPYIFELTVELSEGPTISNISTVFRPEGRLYTVGVGMGTLLWYSFVPALFYLAYVAMTRGLEGDLPTITACAALSLLNAVAGPIDWYYANALPMLYVVSGVALWRALKAKAPTARCTVFASLMLAQSIITFATLLGAIPYEVELAL